MFSRECPYCHQPFAPSRYHPDQVICSNPACQKQRRAEYHRKKLGQDAAYQKQCCDSQRKWREANPDYMRTYRLRQRKLAHKSAKRTPVSPPNAEELVKNTLAMEVKSCPAEIWLLFPNDRVKNTFAQAQIIVIKAVSSKLRAVTQ